MMRSKLSAAALIIALDLLVEREIKGTSPIKNPRGLLPQLTDGSPASVPRAYVARTSRHPYLKRKKGRFA